ncbi:MAG: hypothetical protein FWC70_13170 [Defluviitaleaceae bacterium]|nr:hypothetical protein [Defluviitaleaceae bacterium]
MKKATAFVFTMLAAMTATAVTAFAAGPPAPGLTDLADTLTAELGIILPQLVGVAGTVIGAIAPAALAILSFTVVVGLVISIFRRLMGR